MSRKMAEEIFGNGDFGHVKRDIAAVAYELGAILISFSFRFVSD
jgi:hypothetical protein